MNQATFVTNYRQVPIYSTELHWGKFGPKSTKGKLNVSMDMAPPRIAGACSMACILRVANSGIIFTTLS